MCFFSQLIRSKCYVKPFSCLFGGWFGGGGVHKTTFFFLCCTGVCPRSQQRWAGCFGGRNLADPWAHRRDQSHSLCYSLLQFFPPCQPCQCSGCFLCLSVLLLRHAITVFWPGFAQEGARTLHSIELLPKTCLGFFLLRCSGCLKLLIVLTVFYHFILIPFTVSTSYFLPSLLTFSWNALFP